MTDATGIPEIVVELDAKGMKTKLSISKKGSVKLKARASLLVGGSVDWKAKWSWSGSGATTAPSESTEEDE